jgi:outer membrane immunogenic protein
MRRLPVSVFGLALLTAAAFAADPMPAQPDLAYDWSGFYLGQQLGWGWSDLSLDDGGALDEDVDLNGAFFGGILGYQHQWDWFVLGAEIEANWSDIDGQEAGPPGFGRLFGEVEIFGSVGVKAGYAWDRLLLYGTGGFAGSELGTRERNGAASSDDHDAAFGWMAGGGLDFGVTRHVVLGLQYRHYDLDGADFDMGFVTDREGDARIDAVSGHLIFKVP